MALGLSADSGNVHDVNLALGLLLNLGAAVALVWRHEHPWIVLAAALAGPLFFSTDATAALIVLYAIAKTERGERLAAATIAVYLACAASLTYDAHRTRDNSVLTMAVTRPEKGAPKPEWEIAVWIPWFVAAVLVAIVVGAAMLKHTRSELAQAEHSRDLATEQSHVMRDEVIRTEERTRIARDMHDTLAASLSRISLFAGALQVNGADNPEKIANTASMIRSTAHDALDDLKHIVGVLRGSAAANARPSGHQGIDSVAELVQSARAAGLHATLYTDLQPGDVGTVSGHVTYRVVQESLTNAQKYASDQTIRISISGAAEHGIRIDIRNNLSALPPNVPPGSGSGLRGLAEQAGEIGGTFNAGVLGTEFVATCWLPWYA
ncbi:histidine kinase [Rhodococcus sp. Q]|uniref:sensor histidine kinase n=1 Tax=Rhodococcus sp. Q TaxID=2502252 RepID=UPI0010F54072|nr:histidine kinase [Rhodococcus sp. Q]